MSEFFILDENRNITPCDLMTWAKWFGKADRRVARDEIGGSVVSTVFLGNDHRFGEDGPPLIFETLVFDGPLADEMDRYSTLAEAEAGHQAMVAKVREAIPDHFVPVAGEK